MFSLTRCFKELGHQVTVLTMETHKHRMTERERKVLGGYAAVERVYVDTQINLFLLAANLLFSRKPYNATRFVSSAFASALKHLLTTREFDLVQLEGLYLTPYIQLIRSHVHIPLVLRAHNVEHEIWERIGAAPANPVKKIYLKILASRLRKFETIAINRYDLIVPVTRRDLDTFNAMGNNRPAIICPTGIDSAGHATRKQSDYNKSLFFLGSLDWWPNQEGLLWFVSRVWPLLTSKTEKLLFHVAGRNAGRRLIRALSQPGIVFHGEIDDAQSFMLDHGILVSPVLSGGGMRVKIAEALCLGVPVVTTSIGAEGLDVTDGRELFLADHAEGFAQKIATLLAHPHIYEEMGKEAILFARSRLSDRKCAEELIRFYQNHLA